MASSMGFDIFARDRASRTFDKVGDSADRLERRLSGVGGSASGLKDHFSGLASSVASAGVSLVTSALQLSTLAGAAASAVPAVGGLVAALAPAAGAVAALPAAALLAQGAMATLKLAVSGVEEAFTQALAGDVKKFNEALEGLSPAAKTVAIEFRDNLVPAFNELKSTVQDSFFAPLQGQLAGVAATLSGPLRAGMSGLAGEFGRLAAEGLRFGQSAAAVNLVKGAFATLRAEVGDLESRTLQRLLQAMANFTTSTLPAFQGLGDSVNSLAERFTNFLNRATESGQSLQWVQNALDVFKQLGGILGEVTGIIKGVFSAMREGGAGALGVFGQLLGKVNEFVNSAQGQEILVTIFKALADIGSALSPIISALGGALAQLAPHIANIATALGPGLASAVKALGPALAALGPGLTVVAEQLAKAFASPELQAGLLTLGRGIGDLLTAAAPLLPVIAQLAGILAQVLGGALSNLGAALGPVIVALGNALEPALRSVSDALTLMIPLMAPIYRAFGEIGAALITELLPPVLNLIPAVLNGLIPAFAELARQVQPMIPLLTQLAVKFIQDVLPAILPILPELTKLALEFTKLGLVVAKVVADLAPAIERGIAVFQRMYDILIGHSIIPDMVNGIRDWVGRLPGIFTEWFGRAKDAAIGKFNELVGAVSQIPGRIVSALGNVGNLLFNSGQSIIQGLINGLYSMLQNAYNAAADILGQIRNLFPFSPAKEGPFSGKGWTLFSGQSMAAGLAAGLAKGEGLVSKAAQGLVGAASMSLAPSVTVGAQAALPLAPQGGGLTINLHFSGQPLVSRDEISRLVIAALNEAKGRGFNLGAVGAT